MLCAFNKHQRICADPSGVTSLELALLLVPLMLLLIVVVVFDLGRYLFTVQSMITLMTDTAGYMLITPVNPQQDCHPLTYWFSNTTIAPPPLLDPTQGQARICVRLLNIENTLGV